MNGKIAEENWLDAGRRFGACIRALCEQLGEVNMGVEIQDYPRVLFQADKDYKEVETQVERREQQEQHEEA